VESDLKNENKAASAIDEHIQRIRDLGPAANLYPYQVQGDLIAIRSDISSADINYLYWFLLFATRLNMKNDREHGGYDGAELFEHLCLVVAKNYWGTINDNRVDGMVFGTARNKLAWEDDTEALVKFGENVDTLCKKVGVGSHFRPKHTGKLTAKDDKLDIVVWRNFSDGDKNKLIGFGQCKTGTHWVNELPRLSPDSFCRRWWHDPPHVNPVKLFFLCDRLSGGRFHYGTESGILFDRCRILEYANDLPKDLVKCCADWTRSVMADYGIKWKPNK
jgi:hypothetical protein